MKSNNVEYKVRQLTYKNNELVQDFLYDEIFTDLESVNLFITIAKKIDKEFLPEIDFIYIIEVVCDAKK